MVKVQKTSNYLELVRSEIKKNLFTYIFHLVLPYCVAKGVQFLARTRDARASGVFRFFAFTSLLFACKVLSVSVLRVKASPLVCSRRFTHNRLK